MMKEMKKRWGIGLLAGWAICCVAAASEQARTLWVSSGNEKDRSPLIRSVFEVGDGLVKATAKVSAVGYVELYLNGEKGNRDVLFPDPTQYEKRILFREYDVTNQLHEGNNGVGLWLNEGQAAITLPKKERFYNKIRKVPGVYPAPAGWLELTLEYGDGTVDIVRTDQNWKTANSPLTYAHFYGGENYDARLEKEGWSTAGFDDSGWTPVVKAAPVTAELSESLIPAARVVEELKPIASRNPSPGIFLYDLGQNIGGWWRIAVRGKPGTVVTVRASETLDNRYDEHGFDTAKRVSDKPSHAGNRYARDAMTLYTLKGGELEQYEPRFFYTGYRFIEVVVADPSAIEHLDVTGCVVHNDIPWIGDFKCSDERLNRLHQNTAWSIKGVLQGAPMSNPNSEKYGWTGDVHLFSEAADSIFDMEGVWRKWLLDLRDAQDVVGQGDFIPCTVPNFRIHDGPTSSVWGATYPLTAWHLYRHTGDKSVYAEYYEPIRRWADFLWSNAKDGLVTGIYADHVSPILDANGKKGSLYKTKNQQELLGTAYTILTENILGEMAQVLGMTEEVRLHERRVAKAKEALNQKYFKADKSLYLVEPDKAGQDPLQTANLVPLQMGIEPEGMRASILENISRNIRQKHNNHLMTGIVGTKALVEVLLREGKGELLYDIVTNPTYPGWGFWLKGGATTHWQKWDGSGDHNHAMMGSVEEFLMQGIAGIIPPTEEGTTPGWNHVRISPQILSKLDWAEGKVPTPHGQVISRWERRKSGVLITITFPGPVTGELVLPGNIQASLASGQNSFLLQDGKLKKQ